MKILHIGNYSETIEEFSNILKTKNHDFESVMDGKKALVMIQNNYYDLILIDLVMSGYSGIDFLLDLKKRPTNIQKITVVDSPELDEYQIKFLRDLGADSILQKPISIQNLLSQLEPNLTS